MRSSVPARRGNVPVSSRHLADGLAEASEGEGEEDRAENEQEEKWLPDYVESGTTIENGLGELDEVSGGRS